MQPLAAVAAAYLIGSFPSAYVYTRLFGGRDIRQVGSGNVGGMNAFRNVGPLPGLLTGITDVSKGALAVWLAVRWFPDSPLLVGIAAVSVVAGLAVLRDSYVAVVMGAAALPVSMWVLGGALAHALAGLGLAAVVIAKHTGELRDYLSTRRRR